MWDRFASQEGFGFMELLSSLVITNEETVTKNSCHFENSTAVPAHDLRIVATMYINKIMELVYILALFVS